MGGLRSVSPTCRGPARGLGLYELTQGPSLFRRPREWHLPVVLSIWVLSLPAIAGYGYAGPTVNSPMGPGTVPPSSYERGLANTPNPMSDSGNLVITGNVRGGKHFRGYVPYDSTTSFGAPLGSTRLDSFLRYSAVPQESGDYSRNNGTFYSPTGTVTTIRPGYGGIFAPTSPRVAGGLTQFRADKPANVMPITEIPPSRLSGGERDAVPDSTDGAWKWQPYLPTSGTSEEMRQLISGEPGDQPADRRFAQQGNQPVTPEEHQRRLELWRRDTDGAPLDTPGSEQRRPDPAQSPLPRSVELRLGQPLTEPQRQMLREPPSRDADPRQRPVGEISTEGSPTDASGESPLRLYDRAAESEQSASRPPISLNRIDAIFTMRTEGRSAEPGDTGTLPALRRMEETVGAFDTRAKSLEQPARDLPTGDESSSDGIDSLANRLGAAPGSTRMAVGAGTPPDVLERPAEDRVRQKYQAPTGFAREQFDRYSRTSEMYVRQGHYRRAVDSLTLALLYWPGEPRVHLRKSHALLAAGEYVSSASALARAIELDARRVLRKMELIEAVGGPDQFVRRITELEQSAERSSAPQLQFLLAYVYYQMDRPCEAKIAIEAARKGLPTSPAVGLLKSAIGG